VNAPWKGGTCCQRTPQPFELLNQSNICKGAFTPNNVKSMWSENLGGILVGTQR
jgi:hypothetical protein